MDIKGGWLTVNRYCNFRCSWCYAQGTAFKSQDNMPYSMAVTLVDLMRELGVGNVVLIGGETLFYPHLFPLATYIKSKGMTSAVVTNGWLLGHSKFRDRVGASDVTSINISLKGASRQEFASVTGFDGFDRVCQGIAAASGWKHIPTGVSTVISTQTLGSVVELAKTAFGCGAAMVSYTMCNPSITEGSFDGSFMPNPQDVVNEFEAGYDEIQAVSGGNFSIEGTLPACLWHPDFLAKLEGRGQMSYGCHFKTRSGVLFDRWGRVIPCNHLFDYPIGQYGVDFTGAASFARMWDNPALADFYGKMLAYPTQACIGCSTFDRCGGGCPLNWFVREPTETIGKGVSKWTS